MEKDILLQIDKQIEIFAQAYGIDYYEVLERFSIRCEGYKNLTDGMLPEILDITKLELLGKYNQL